MISSVGLTAQERGDFDAFLIGIVVFLRLRRGGRGAGLHRRLLTRGAGLRLAFGVAGHPVDQGVDAETALVALLTLLLRRSFLRPFRLCRGLSQLQAGALRRRRAVGM